MGSSMAWISSYRAVARGACHVDKQRRICTLCKASVAPTNPRAANWRLPSPCRVSRIGMGFSKAMRLGGATVDTLQITDCPNIALRAHVSVRATPFVRQLLTDRSRVTAYDAMVTDIDLIEEIDTSDGKQLRCAMCAMRLFPDVCARMVLLTGHKPLRCIPQACTSWPGRR